MTGSNLVARAEMATVEARLEASLPLSVRSAMREVRRTWWSDSGDGEHNRFEVEFIGFEHIDAPASDLERAREAVAAALSPAPKSLIKAEVARLRLTTKCRAEEQEELDLMTATYAEYLAEYPADIVVEACRFWARNEKFWPAWAELKEQLDRRVRRRRALAAALR